MLVSTMVVVQYSSRRVVERDWRIVAVPEEDVAKQQRQAKGHLPLLKGKTKLTPHSSHFFLTFFEILCFLTYYLIGGRGLQNKIKMRMLSDFSHFNCLRNNEFYLCGLASIIMGQAKESTSRGSTITHFIHCGSIDSYRHTLPLSTHHPSYI